MITIQDKFEFLRANVVNLSGALTEEQDVPDGVAKHDHEFGTLYFHPRVGEAFEYHGLIPQTYRDMGEQDSAPGYPPTDQVDDPGSLADGATTSRAAHWCSTPPSG
jgi:hypothetical protein